MEGSMPPDADVKNFHKCNLCDAIFTQYILLEQHCELHLADIEDDTSGQLCNRLKTNMEKDTTRRYKENGGEMVREKDVKSPRSCHKLPETGTSNNMAGLDTSRRLKENGEESFSQIESTRNSKNMNSHKLQKAPNSSENMAKGGDPPNSWPKLPEAPNTSEHVTNLKISQTGGAVTCRMARADGNVRLVSNSDEDGFSDQQQSIIESDDDIDDEKDVSHVTVRNTENIPGSNQRLLMHTGGLVEMGETSESEQTAKVSDYGESDTDLPINFSIEPKPKREKCFTCDVCSKSFTLQSSLNRHSKLHIGDFICSVCGDLFADNQTLKKHARIHIVKKRFKCRSCGDAFKLSSSLKKHILSCHKADKEKTNVSSKDETDDIQHVPESAHEPRKNVGESNADDTALPLPDNLDYNTDSAGQSSQNIFKCDFCAKIFTLRSSLLRHTKRHTLLATCFQCHVCCKTFTLKSSLQRHFMRKHKTPKSPNQSTDLDGSLSSVEETSKNDQSLDIKNLVPIPAVPKKEKPFKCYVCGNTFGHSSSLQRHLKTHTELGEGSEDKVIQCEICSETFSQFFNLQKHIMSHTGQKPFKCEYCEKSFFENGHLRQHIRIHTGERPYQCHVCSKAFSQGSSLRIHMKIHSSDIEEKQFICIVCSKSFSNFGNLQKHIVKHSGIRPYKCEICDKSFLEKNHLEKHRRIHTGEKNYVCHICSKAFTQYGNMKQHIKTHTGERTHICHVCSKGFTENSKLTEHMKIHTGERKFKCEICFKLFRQNNGLTRHMRKHTGEKPFHCDVCYKQFGHSNSLKKHKQSHNRIEIIID